MTTAEEAGSESVPIKSIRLILAIVLPLAILGGGYMGMNLLRAMLKPPPRKERKLSPLKVRCVELQPRTVRLFVEGFGSVRPKAEIRVAAQVTGRVDYVAPNLKVGAFVHKDEELFRIEPTDFKQAVDQVRAQIVEAETELKRIDQDEYNLKTAMEVQKEKVAVTKRELERIDQALKSEAVTVTAREATALIYLNNQATLVAQQNDLALIPVRREKAQATLNVSKVRLKDAELDLERTVIRSPADALVTSENLEPGQILTALQTVATLASTDAYEVPVIVDADQLERLDGLPSESIWREKGVAPVTVQAKATVTWLAFQNAFTWEGTLTRLEPFDAKTRTAPLIVEVPHPLTSDGRPARPRLALQAYCRVRIEGRELTEALIVPEQAVQEGSRLFLVNTNQTLRIEPIRVRMRVDGDAVIQAETVEENGVSRPSVKPGDRVITTPILYPVKDMEVEIITGEAGTGP